MKLSAYMNRIEKDNKFHKKVVDYVCLDPELRAITDFGDGFEGFFVEEGQPWYLPHLTLSKNMEVCDLCCNCAEAHGLYIHKAGLIWGVNLMQQMECRELWEAIRCYCEKNGLENTTVEYSN